MIQLTRVTGMSLWINMALVRVMARYKDHTWLEFGPDFVYEVTETPEEILKRLEAATR